MMRAMSRRTAHLNELITERAEQFGFTGTGEI